jgi:hypothetical protein
MLQIITGCSRKRPTNNAHADTRLDILVATVVAQQLQQRAGTTAACSLSVEALPSLVGQVVLLVLTC